jgi:hypothetical protein
MANPKVADVIKQAQLYVKDVNGEKYDAPTVLGYLNTAIGLLFARHPSAFYVTSIITEAPEAVEMGGEIAVSPDSAEALAHYVASQCLYESADDEFNARLAKSHLDLFASLSA